MQQRKLSGKERGNASDLIMLSLWHTDNSHTRHQPTGITKESSNHTTRVVVASVMNKCSTDILKGVTAGKKHNKIIMNVGTQFRENSLMSNT